MKCPYQDIGCWYINDESHDCEAKEMGGSCSHKPTKSPENNRVSKTQENGK